MLVEHVAAHEVHGGPAEFERAVVAHLLVEELRTRLEFLDFVAHGADVAHVLVDDFLVLDDGLVLVLQLRHQVLLQKAELEPRHLLQDLEYEQRTEHLLLADEHQAAACDSRGDGSLSLTSTTP